MPLSVERAAPPPALATAAVGLHCPVPRVKRRRLLPTGLPWTVALSLLLGACTTPAPQPAAPVTPVPVVVPASAAPEPAPVVAEPPPAPPTPEALERDATQQLLRFHERIRDLSAPELTREIARLELRLQASPPAEVQAGASTPAPGAAAAAASAAALPASAAASTPPVNTQARTTPGTAPAAQHSLELALLLAQQRQNGDLTRALGLLEPLQRPAAPAATQALARLLHARLSEQRRLEEQLERQGQSVRELQRRADQLTAQLEALRAIERSLNARPPAPSTSPSPPPSSAPAPVQTPAAPR